MYYPTRYITGWQAQGVNGLVPTSEVTYVEVDADATGDAIPWPMPYAAAHAKQLQVPPYPDPLSHSPNPRAWWAAHRPLVLQTGALGPMENNQVSFSGFRMLSVKGDVIDKVHSISINRLEANGYRLSLEDAGRPDPPRRHRHSERSRRHHAPDAECKPAAIWLPQLGVSNVTYRDTQDRLHERWKNTADSGASNLTGLAGAPAAASDPSPYFDAADRQLVVISRDSNGKVYSLFWSTGPVGYNLLTPRGGQGRRQPGRLLRRRRHPPRHLPVQRPAPARAVVGGGRRRRLPGPDPGGLGTAGGR